MDEKENKELIELVNEIKADILATRNSILRNANYELISMYFRIGKSISENASYGSNFINLLSVSLKHDFPDTTGFSPRNLSRMKKFYEEYCDLPNLPPAVANLSWTHNYVLIEKVKDINKRIWYAKKAFENSWSKVVLNHQIELQLYERQADNEKKLNNFSKKLPILQGELAKDMLKDPYIFEISGLKERAIEKDIENAMIEKIRNIILEFGKGFSFVGNQYKLSTENKDYYIDLLFYHLDLRCYVVVELKNVDFDPAFVGQLQFYVTAVNEKIKKEMDNPTIGLLLCKSKDRLSVEWALKPINVPIGVASYEIKQYLPSNEELNRFLK